jgi:predicted transcriptional regulator of viral defense system
MQETEGKTMARPKTTVDLDALGLPAAFTSRAADEAGLTRGLRSRLIAEGALIRFSRGLYRQANANPVDLDLLEVALRTPAATICLTSALTRHELTDEIPSALDLALPRGKRHPVGPVVARWHSFDPDTFTIGRGLLTIEEGISVGLYSAERSIIDAFNTRGTTGTEIAVEALRRWLRRKGAQPAELLTMATAWPRAQAPLRRAIEILL